jgi:hypothetical protein
MLQLTTERRRTARLLFWVALAFAVVMALLPHPPRMPTDRFGDKFNHMLAFSVLSALSVLAFPHISRWKIIWRLSIVGALIEVAQAIPFLHRDCDVRDWIADMLAVMVVMGVVTLITRRTEAVSVRQGR